LIPFIGFRISDIVFPPGIKELEEEILIVWIAIPLSTDCFYTQISPHFYSIQPMPYQPFPIPFTRSSEGLELVRTRLILDFLGVQEYI
jgi:hypothetical protein